MTCTFRLVVALRSTATLFAIAIGSFVANESLAVERVYQIVPELSFITLVEGNDAATTGSTITVTSPLTATLPIKAQSSGVSLTASYSGTIKTDRNGSNIKFIAGSNADAATSGSWQPLAGGASGNALADYGGKVTVFSAVSYFAGRDFAFDFASGDLAISGGNFNLAGTNASFIGGAVDYNVPAALGGQQGSSSVFGESVGLNGTGTLNLSGVIETLTIPISGVLDSSLADASGHLVFSGQLVATAVVPEPSAIILGSFAVAGLSGLVWRQRRKKT